MMESMYYVVGSGPAGVSCAKALLAQGVAVTMLDAGISLEPTRESGLQKMQHQIPKQWNLSLFKTGSTIRPTFKGVPQKFVYGSDFAYRTVQEELHIEERGVLCRQSFARGGLSNVWGAAVLPYVASDIRDWPISLKELTLHYQAVRAFIPSTGRNDALSSLFPAHGALEPWKRSSQAEQLFATAAQHEQSLRQAGFVIGDARLAVRVQPTQQRPGCVYCKLCITGCPYQLIYSAAHTIQGMMTHPKFTYIPHVVVDMVEEVNDGVHIITHHLTTGRSRTFLAKRVFLGCGVIATGRIMLASTGKYDAPLTIKDSQGFLIPALQYKAAKHPQKEPMHTMAQAFIELRPLITKTSSVRSSSRVKKDPLQGVVHMQVYGYNALYEEAIRNRFGPLFWIAKYPAQLFIDRLIILLGFLHSDVSTTMRMTLTRTDDVLHKRETSSGKNALDDVLAAKVVITPSNDPKEQKRMRAAFRSLCARLREQRSSFGFLPVLAGARLSEPGKSSHFGATFPMRKRPCAFGESDILGRPFDDTTNASMQRVHLVDASVFVSIPATTITLSVMANAHRIGTLAAQLDAAEAPR